MQKKNLLCALLATGLVLSAAGCSDSDTAGAASSSINEDSWVYKNLNVLQTSTEQETILSTFNALFDQTAQENDNKMIIQSKLNGSKLNFINMDDIFSSDSITVDDYTITRKFYALDENVYQESMIADDTLTYSLSTKDTFYSATGVANEDGYTVILSDSDTQTLNVSDLAEQFLAAPMIIEPLMQETLYLSPLEQPAYFDYQLSQNNEDYILTISIKNMEEFNEKNRDLMEASGINTEFLEKIEVSEDTLTLTMSAKGVLSKITQTCSVNYVDGDETASQELTLSADIQKLDAFDTQYVDDLFASEIEISKTVMESK